MVFLLSFGSVCEGGGGGGGRILFSFFFCSQHVPFKFPIALCFNPICFALSPPLLTYIGGPKGEALHLFIESFILRSLHNFNVILQWANQIGSLQTKKKKELSL
jgi:hypothetical protein